jgi:hypothetical protein
MEVHRIRLGRLSSAGRAIHGDDWQSPMARALAISDRHLRRWVSGEQPVPAWVDASLERILHKSAAAMTLKAESLNQLSIRFSADAGVI